MFSTNLFGTQTNPNNPPQQTSTGLFGSTLFGNTNQMGQQGQQQQQPQQFQQQPQQQPQQQTQHGLWGANVTQPTNLNKGLFPQPTNTSSSGSLGGMFGAPPSGSTGKNKNNILGMFGTNTGMQAPGFSSSVFPQASPQGLMGAGNIQQPGGGMFGVGGNLGTGPSIFGGGPTNQPLGIPQNQGGSNIFNQQQQNAMQPNQNLGIAPQGMGFGLGQQNQPSGSGLFGATSSTNVLTNVFGGVPATTSSGLFGQSAMGSTSTMQQPSNTMGMMGKGGLFGSTMGQAQPQGFQTSNLGLGGVSTGIPQTQMKGTHVYKYEPIRTQETSVANGQQKIDHTNMNAITSMPQYANRSIEELRYEDYMNKKMGIVPQQPINQPMSNILQPNQPSGMGMFGNQPSLLQQTQKTNPFQTGILQTQQTQQPPMAGSLFSTAPDNKPSFLQNQPSIQQPQQQTGGMNFFPQQTTNMMGFAQPQQQNTSLLVNHPQPGGTCMFQKSILSPSKTGILNQPAFQGIGGNAPQQSNLGGLFATQQPGSLFTQPTNQATATSMLGGTQQSTGMFQQPKAQATSLFSTGPAMQPSQMPTQSSMFDLSKGTSMQQTGNIQGGFFASNLSATQVPTQQQYPTITQLQVTPESADFRNYLTNSMYKQKSITELLNDLQRHYQEQDFFLNDDYSARKPKISKDINLGESKYSYPSIIPESRQFYDYDHQREKYDFYGSFLKSKRNYNQPKIYGSGGKGLYREEFRQPEEPKFYKPLNLLDFQYKKDEPKSPSEKEESDEIKLKKSHSCDLIKKNETVIVNNLEKSFVSKINIEDQMSNTRAKKISLENTFLDLHVSLQDPIKTSFNLKMNKNSKVTLLKSAIVDHLKDKYPKLFKKLNVNSFVLMKKYSILKDTILLSEADVKDRETLHVLLKENFNYNTNSNAVDSSKLHTEEVQTFRKESTGEKKRKKDELAPLNKLPTLEKPGYKTIPDFKDIYRMTIDELENVENFSIYNDWGRIDFEGVTDLTNLNLDQIVTIENKLINVYQNGDIDFKPKVGKGLNKPAILHLYKCFPSESQKGITDEQLSLYLASLQKISKEKGV